MLTQLEGARAPAACTQEGALPAPVQLRRVTGAGSFAGSLRREQGILNTPQPSVGDLIAVGLKSKLKPRISYRVLETLIMDHVRRNSVALARIRPHDL